MKMMRILSKGCFCASAFLVTTLYLATFEVLSAEGEMGLPDGSSRRRLLEHKVEKVADLVPRERKKMKIILPDNDDTPAFAELPHINLAKAKKRHSAVKISFQRPLLIPKVEEGGPKRVTPSWQKRSDENRRVMGLSMKKVSDVMCELVNTTELYAYPSRKGPHLSKLRTLQELEKVAKRLKAIEVTNKAVTKQIIPVDTYLPDLQCNCTPVHIDPAYFILKDDFHKEEPYTKQTAKQTLDRRHPNLALKFITDEIQHCALMPDVTSIDWLNLHWQQFSLQDPSEKLYLYSAFYDNRTLTKPAGGVVRVLGLFSGAYIVDEEDLPWCHLWYDGAMQPLVSRAIRAEYVDHQDPTDEHMETYLLTCQAPDRQHLHPTVQAQVPYAVSLVLEPCHNATNLLKVVGKANKELPPQLLSNYKPNFADSSDPAWRIGLCATAMFYLTEDYTNRLVEWLELMRAQGVSQIFFYHTGRIHPNLDKVLNYYEKQGFVSITDFHYPPSYMDEPLLRKAWTKVLRKHMFALENVYYTDCVLRNKDAFRFLAHVDPDEMLVMENQAEQSLPQFVAYLSETTRDSNPPIYSYNIRWRFFPAQEPATTDPLPRHFHVLRHPYRLVTDTEPQHHNVKTIYDTLAATGVTSHTLRVCGDGACPKPYTVPMTIATMGHFRDDCTKICGGETELVPEVNKHRDSVVRRVLAALTELQLLPKEEH